MSAGRRVMQPVVRTLRLARNPQVVAMVRRLGLYAPLRLVYEGAGAKDWRRYRELLAFRRRYRRLFAGVRTQPGATRTILFPQLFAGLDRLRVEAMLAKGLQAEGARPVFLLDRHEIWPEEHLRAFGFDEFVYVDGHLPPLTTFDTEAARMLEGCRTQEDVLALRFGGLDVGRHASSVTLKLLRRGSVDPLDPELHRELAHALSQSMRWSVAVNAVLDDLRPDALVNSVQNYTPWAEFFQAGTEKGIDVIHWGRSHLENSFLFRRYDAETRNDHFVTLSDASWDALRAVPWTQDDARSLLADLRASYAQPTWLARKGLAGKQPRTADEIRARLELDPSKKTAFVFSHLLYDATFWFGTSLFPNYVEWLLDTVAAAIENPELNWVIKLHPENVRRWRQAVGAYTLESLEEWQLITERFGELPGHVRLMLPDDDTSTLSLFAVADVVLTVRGTVGLEFPCFGIPAVTAGAGGYSGRGFTLDSATREEYFERLATLHRVDPLDPDEVELAQRFARGLLHLKPVTMTSFRWYVLPEDEQDLGLASWAFEPVVKTPTELRTAEDLRYVARWIVDSDAIDLLGPQAEPVLAAAPVASREL